MTESEKGKISRRNYLKYAGGVVAAAVVVGAGYGIYEATKPAPIVPSPTTATATQVVTSSVPPTGTPTGVNVAYMGAGGVTSDHASFFAAQCKQVTGDTLTVNAIPYASYEDKLMLSLTSHSGAYDIICFTCTDLAQISQYMLPLTDFIARDGAAMNFADFVPQMVQNHATYKNVVYGIPWLGDARMFFYRTDLFAKNGIKSVPETEDDLIADAKLLTLPGGVFYGFADQYAQGAQDTFCFAEELWKRNTDFFDSNWKPIFNSAAGIDGLNFMMSVLQDKIAPQACVTYAFDEVMTAFTQDEAAMVNNFPFMGVDAEDPTSSKVAGKMGTGVMPRPANGIHAGYTGGWSLGICKDSKNQAAAWEVIKYLTSPTVDAYIYTGKMPSRISTYSNAILLKSYPWLPGILANEEHARVFPKIPEMPEVQDTIGLWVHKALTGELSVKDALDGGAAAVYDIMNAHGYYGGTTTTTTT
jgi:multiple sugar transport system substrate-binding protein